MRKILGRILILGVLVTGALYVTNAFFSDTETSTGNTFAAGELDLEIDNTSYLNGSPYPGTTWQLASLNDGNGPAHGSYLFFNFNDLKPDDEGEDTISLHVKNDSYACMSITKTEDDDETCTEPEQTDDPTCNEPDTDLLDGELGGLLHFIFWADDGDNVLEDDETIFRQGLAGTLFDGAIWPLADSLDNIWEPSPGQMLANQTYYIGKAWCFGTLTTDPIAAGQGVNPTVDSGVNCDGTTLNNASQTDKFMADIAFSAVQARHNGNFVCTPGVTPSPGVSPSPTPTPSPLACSQADVMLVLDRSGSINSTELSQLKTAAKDFVDALGLTTIGIHAGKSSFATTGSLNHHLTDDPVSLKAAIDAMTSGGLTNLKEGIELATTEQANPGDGHDRADLTSPDKMIVVTDGNPNEPGSDANARTTAAAAADAARSAGAEIFVVGVGSDVDATYLQTEIANDAGHYYSASDYSGLQTTLQDLDLCNGQF